LVHAEVNKPILNITFLENFVKQMRPHVTVPVGKAVDIAPLSRVMINMNLKLK
jgi:hypothetical protein